MFVQSDETRPSVRNRNRKYHGTVWYCFYINDSAIDQARYQYGSYQSYFHWTVETI